MGLWLFGPEGNRQETHPGRRVEEISVGCPEIRDPEGVRMNGDDTVDGSEIRDPLTSWGEGSFIPLWKQGFIHQVVGLGISEPSTVFSGLLYKKGDHIVWIYFIQFKMENV